MPELKKVLIVAYYWPPSGGSGVQRWLKFVKYLRNFGWEPIVFTVSNPDFSLRDETLLADVPENLKVLTHPIWEPFAIYNKFMGQKDEGRVNPVYLASNKNASFKDRLAVWIRGNLFIPDARMFWIKPASGYLVNWLKNNNVDAIVTTGPPHSMHLIGQRIKRATGLPWLADFRDPWTKIDFYQELRLSKWADNKHHALEKAVANQADHLVVIGNTMKEEFSQITPKPITVITNGYDEADFIVSKGEKEHTLLDEKFSILHVGMLGKARNHPVFWRALFELRLANKDFAHDMVVKFYGKADPVVEESVRQHQAESWVKFYPYLPHNQIIQVQRKAQLLLLSVNNTHNAKGILTGKIFEYLAIQRPILGIGPVDGDAASVLNHTGAGLISDFEDLEGLKNNILYYYNLYRQKTLSVDPTGTEKYSRRNLTEKLAEVLNSLVPG
jgi:glycosyltransferase involved in cell wall biosynthesis